MPVYHILTFDIGATKTNAALYTGRSAAPFELVQLPFSQSYQNVDFGGTEEILAAGVNAAGASVDIAVLAVAGPVAQLYTQMTNRPWSIDQAGLQDRFNIPHLFIINDLEALAYGIPYLQPKELHGIQGTPPATRATIAVVAPGTGLGESFMMWSGDKYFVCPSEGGHCDFAPVDLLQIELLQFLLEEYDHVSYERLCSGPGLHNIYRFLKAYHGVEEPDWLAEKFAIDHQPPKTIITVANDPLQSNDICRQTVDLFVAILGAEAGNMALRTLPRGGVYIGGGLPHLILPFFKTGQFMAAFNNKGRMGHILKTIPVHIVLNPRIPLYGAAHYGLQSVVDGVT